MPTQPTEDMSSSEVRDRIFSQHVVLRGLLAEMTEVADRVATSEGELEALRGRAQALYDALTTHLEFEEQVLPAALRDVIGWGAVIQQRIEEDHLRQRSRSRSRSRRSGRTAFPEPTSSRTCARSRAPSSSTWKARKTACFRPTSTRSQATLREDETGPSHTVISRCDSTEEIDCT